MKKLIILIIFMLVISSSFFSCSSDDTTEISNENAAQEAQADITSDNVDEEAEKLMKELELDTE